jgi:ABC-type transporter Mla subunit MlaD
VLKARGGSPPTVPLSHTTEPVSLLDLFNMFNVPTQQRFQVIISELGIATAGRGADFNDVLRRANPALALARQVISILARQKAQLATIVAATNTIAREGAGHTTNLQRFLDRSASLASLTAAHRDPLARSIARLPGLLAAAQPALRKLDTVAVDGTPLLAQLRVAAPALDQASTDLGPFVKAARPGLADLGVALRQAIPAIRDTTPVVSQLASYTHRSLPGALQFARLGTNLQQHGFVENFLSVIYYVGASLARFDKTSHMLSILLVGPNNGKCSQYTATPVAGCSAHYFDDPSAKYRGTAAAVQTPRNASRRTRTPRLNARGVSGRQRRPSSSGAGLTASQAVQATPNPLQQSTASLQNLVNYLFR